MWPWLGTRALIKRFIFAFLVLDYRTPTDVATYAPAIGLFRQALHLFLYRMSAEHAPRAVLYCLALAILSLHTYAPRCLRPVQYMSVPDLLTRLIMYMSSLP